MDTIERQVVLAVCGMSPQIITETLYGLMIPASARPLPTEVHLLTTADGARKAHASLLAEGTGFFHRFCRDYGLDHVRFEESHIHVITDRQGEALADIRLPQDNEDAADFIVEKVRHFTSDPACRLHASIAGGRKTMGYYLGYAMSLLGRPDDQLSHVLVAEGFEHRPDFFYPTPHSQPLPPRNPGAVELDAQDACVSLALIPFVRLRQELPRESLLTQRPFRDLVQLLESSRQGKGLQLDVSRDRNPLIINGMPVGMSYMALSFYAWFLKRHRDGRTPLPAPKKWDGDKDYAAEFLAVYNAVRPGAEPENMAVSLARGMSREFFDETKSQVNKAIKKALGLQAFDVYGIRRQGTRGESVFTLAVDAGQISIKGGV